MAVIVPQPVFTMSDPTQAYDYLEQPPVFWSVAGEEINASSQMAHTGRYVEPRGEIHSTGTPLRQDTFMAGTAGRTGYGFQNVAGSWTSNERHSEYHVYGIGIASGAPATAANDARGTDKFSEVPSLDLIVRRGQPPVSAAGTPDTTHSGDTNYCYILIGDGSSNNVCYRICLAYARPVQVQVSYDGQATWKTVKGPRDLGTLERYLIGNDREMRIALRPDARQRQLSIEFGDGDWVTDSPLVSQVQGAAPDAPLLPRNGSLRFQVQNGTFRAWVLPMRFTALTVERVAPRPLDDPQAYQGDAALAHNALTQSKPDQTLTPAITSDGQSLKYSATVARPDAGEGLGSDTPAVTSDVCLLIPPRWTGDGPPQFLVDLPTGTLRCQAFRTTEVSDDSNQCKYLTGSVVANNYDGLYNGGYSNFALSLDAACLAGGPSYRVFTGWADASQGIGYHRNDPTRTVTLAIRDRSLSMFPAHLDELTFDGWYLYAVVRWLAQMGGIHPRYLTGIPDLPYGPQTVPPGSETLTDVANPYYQLPRGYGRSPRLRFLNQSPWQILQELVKKCVALDPLLGTPAPFYMGFSPRGNFHFEPVSFISQTPVCWFSDSNDDGTGLFQFVGDLEIVNDNSNMRTSVDAVGLDGNTYELLYTHRPAPDYVKKAVGFRNPLLMRDPSWQSQAYLEYNAQALQIPTTLPTQRVRFTVPFAPWFHAGDVFGVTERKLLQGSIVCKADEVTHESAIERDGKVTALTSIKGKNVLDTL